MNKEIEDILKDLNGKMKPSRYNHTVGVMHTACNLAFHYGIDYQKAAMAAVLHDCAKINEVSDYIKECKKYGLIISEDKERSPHLLHADLGVYFAEKRYNINDPDILDAIRFHTTGRPNMTMLEKIIFLADYIEPGRKEIPGLNEIRANAYKDINYSVYLCCKNVINYLKGKRLPICEATINTVDYYLSNQEGIWQTQEK